MIKSVANCRALKDIIEHKTIIILLILHDFFGTPASRIARLFHLFRTFFADKMCIDIDLRVWSWRRIPFVVRGWERPPTPASGWMLAFFTSSQRRGGLLEPCLAVRYGRFENKIDLNITIFTKDGAPLVKGTQARSTYGMPTRENTRVPGFVIGEGYGTVWAFNFHPWNDTLFYTTQC